MCLNVVSVKQFIYLLSKKGLFFVNGKKYAVRIGYQIQTRLYLLTLDKLWHEQKIATTEIHVWPTLFKNWIEYLLRVVWHDFTKVCKKKHAFDVLIYECV